MSIHSRRAMWALAVIVIIAAATGVRAQMQYARGQNVAPTFEGWEHNPDGTISLVFGYLNRNYEEEVDIPSAPRTRSPGSTWVATRVSRRISTRDGSDSCSESWCRRTGTRIRKGCMDADFPRPDRSGEGMAPAGMGTEPGRDCREYGRRRARGRQPTSVRQRQRRTDVHDRRSGDLDGFGDRRRASETGPADLEHRDRRLRFRECGREPAEAPRRGLADQMDSVPGSWKSDVRSR